MNYIKEINAFRNYLKTHPLEAITQALWYVIIDFHNSCNWERWIAINNSRLTAELQVSEKTLIKHRNKLIQAGLLDYKSQQRKKNSGKYKLLSFMENEINRKKTTVENTVEDKTTGNITADSSADSSAEQGADCSADHSDLNKLNKTKLNNKEKEEEKSPLVDQQFKKVVNVFNNNIHLIAPIEIDVIREWINKVEADVIIEAIREAVKNNARSIKYIEATLQNWHSKGAITKDAVIAHLRDYQDRKGKVVPIKGGESHGSNNGKNGQQRNFGF